MRQAGREPGAGRGASLRDAAEVGAYSALAVDPFLEDVAADVDERHEAEVGHDRLVDPDRWDHRSGGDNGPDYPDPELAGRCLVFHIDLLEHAA